MMENQLGEMDLIKNAILRLVPLDEILFLIRLFLIFFAANTRWEGRLTEERGRRQLSLV